RSYRDWSSDVCSSDLPVRGDEFRGSARRGRADIRDEVDDRNVRLMADRTHDGHAGSRDGPCQAFVVEAPQVLERSAPARDDDDEIGRASCRESGYIAR